MKKRIVVIGGGPGGYVAAIRAAQLGAEVHLVEKEYLGGTCLNVGCIPTKALLHTAELYHTLRHGAHGLTIGQAQIDWKSLMVRKESIVKRLVQGVAGLLKANKVELHMGQAVLQYAHTVAVSGPTPVQLTADIVVLAVGSVPVQIPVPGVNHAGVIDSTGALSLPQIPKSLVIIGGGVIGTEFAALYNAFGTKVTVVEMMPQILPPVDGQVAARLREHLVNLGVTFMTEARLSEIKKKAAGLTALIWQGSEQQEVTGEYILIATGRKASVGGMGLEAAGVLLDQGKIVVNEHFATTVPHIYAIGDCNAQIMLAHAASAQGVAAVEHALGHQSVYNGEVIPYCIYTSPEVAGVGITEEQAQARGLAYKTGVFPLMANGKSLIEGCESGLVKIIADEQYGTVLGAHIVGPRATDLIAEMVLAMTLEATVDELIATIHAHPTVSEAIAEAALQVRGQAIHWPPGVKVG